METFIDNDMIRRRLKTNPYEFQFTKFCFNTEPFSNELNKTINYTFFNTFKLKDMDKIYSMINEHVTDLNEIAQNFIAAETGNTSDASGLQTGLFQ